MGPFLARVFVLALLVLLGLMLWRLRDALSVGFGSIILAVGFRGLANGLKQRTGLHDGVALAIVVLATLGTVAASFEVFGSTMVAQYDELSSKLPASLRTVTVWLSATPLGHEMVTQARGAFVSVATGSGPRLVAGLLTGFGQVLTYALVMVAGGVFLAIDPVRYHDGFLTLVPRSRRARYDIVLDALTLALRQWMLSRLIVMVAVGVMSSLGLWALGIDAPFALGLTGAILTFIPNLGSVMSALPGMLIAYLQDPFKALAVAFLFWAVHFVEGTFITPYVQDEAVDVPPVISIFSTVVFALLLGPFGVFLSGPFTVAAIVLVNHFYIEDVLGERVRPRKRERPRWPWSPRRAGAS